MCGYDAERWPVIFELKRRRVGPDAVNRRPRYAESVDADARGSLVASSLAERAEALFHEFDVEPPEVAPPMDVGVEDRSLAAFVAGEKDSQA